ncbi:MAG: hypothetical protein PHU25_19440 [Deltaproteobacteria bacterium]|nr:hypothetical protein [Deltaproteobacteria bacterium]
MSTKRDSGIAERSAQRRRRIVAHLAAGYEDAEAWDLDYWLGRTPQERLSALVAIRRDVAAIEAGRGKKGKSPMEAEDGLDT